MRNSGCLIMGNLFVRKCSQLPKMSRSTSTIVKFLQRKRISLHIKNKFQPTSDFLRTLVINICFIYYLENQKKIQEINNNSELLQVVSKNQGWITVNTNTLDRKRPYEKGGIGGDATKTSILTP